MESALKDGVLDVIGVGRPLCGMPNGSQLLLAGEIDALPSYEENLGVGYGWSRWLVGPTSRLNIMGIPIGKLGFTLGVQVGEGSQSGRMRPRKHVQNTIRDCKFT